MNSLTYLFARIARRSCSGRKIPRAQKKVRGPQFQFCAIAIRLPLSFADAASRFDWIIPYRGTASLKSALNSSKPPTG
jgi:hypothetical protein